MIYRTSWKTYLRNDNASESDTRFRINLYRKCTNAKCIKSNEYEFDLNRKEGNGQESIQLPNLTPSVQDTKAKEGNTKSNGTTIKTLQAENQKDNFFPKSWPNGYPK